jgi:tetratricopeptide (TPR) repeat protein
VIPPKARALAAIECTKRAAELYLTAGQLDDWARAENNLGLSNCELAKKGSPELWKDAIDHVENALCVSRREREPQHYAATMQNLGSAHRALPDGDRAGNIRKAIDCYRRALRVYRARVLPLQNAALHNNLGNAFFSLPATDQAAKNRNIWRALRHFERALEIRTRGDHPCDYAETQLNRGQALLQLEDGNEDANWSVAISCFLEAALCFRQCGNDVNADFAQQRLLWAWKARPRT